MTTLTLDDLFRLTRSSNSFVVRVDGAAGQQPPPKSMGADARKESYRAHLADIAKRKLHEDSDAEQGDLTEEDLANIGANLTEKPIDNPLPSGSRFKIRAGITVEHEALAARARRRAESNRLAADRAMDRAAALAVKQLPPTSEKLRQRKLSYAANLTAVAQRSLTLVAKFSENEILSFDPAGGRFIFQSRTDATWKNWEVRWSEPNAVRLIIRRRKFSKVKESYFDLGHITVVDGELALKVRDQPIRAVKVNTDVPYLQRTSGKQFSPDDDGDDGHDDHGDHGDELTEEDLARIRGQLPDAGRYVRERGG